MPVLEANVKTEEEVSKHKSELIDGGLKALLSDRMLSVSSSEILMYHLANDSLLDISDGFCQSE